MVRPAPPQATTSRQARPMPTARHPVSEDSQSWVLAAKEVEPTRVLQAGTPPSSGRASGARKAPDKARDSPVIIPRPKAEGAPVGFEPPVDHEVEERWPLMRLPGSVTEFRRAAGGATTASIGELDLERQWWKQMRHDDIAVWRVMRAE
ncbi:hypothetical protein KEM52_003957, partial [Ascosphaera acerosa]